MNEPTETLAAAQRWAHLLDKEKFDVLEQSMTPGVIYESPSGLITGPKTIADSYRKNAIWAHATFDEITWDSEVEVLDATSARFMFTDRTLHQGLRHVYHCQQVVWFNEAWLVEKIRHEAIPEEEKALAAFFDRVGVTR